MYFFELHPVERLLVSVINWILIVSNNQYLTESHIEFMLLCYSDFTMKFVCNLLSINFLHSSEWIHRWKEATYHYQILLKAKKVIQTSFCFNHFIKSCSIDFFTKI